MATAFTSIVAAKKLASIKKNYKFSTEDTDQVSPETERKLNKKIEKDQRKREKQKQEREEQHEERDRQREKLRDRIREKYNINQDVSNDSDNESKKSKKNEKKKDLKEKDFYKYNKAMPDERGKSLQRSELGKADNFVETSSKLTEMNFKKKEKNECIIS